MSVSGRKRRGDDGGASVDLMLLAPVLVLLLVLMVVAGRQVSAALTTQDVASAAARAASLQRDTASARAHAQAVAHGELAERGLSCSPFTVSVDVSGFDAGGTAEVEVVCTVNFLDLGGLGERTLRASAASPVDPYRGETP
ncbi:TadE/TadG family type IV pilus assembly protein [Nocardiopsis salina]|uniref:TadE/TadG family type IV pilus assembly protein n=1 Tax=Nocardiopsis salina TaxID=245836 RepID=UPI0004783C25|nr:TadE/TadG family type IV pilus assembly protein [Nocardiopsis salina]